MGAALFHTQSIDSGRWEPPEDSKKAVQGAGGKPAPIGGNSRIENFFDFLLVPLQNNTPLGVQLQLTRYKGPRISQSDEQ